MSTREPRSPYPRGRGRDLTDGSGPPATRPDLLARLCLGLAVGGALVGLVGFVVMAEEAALTLSRVITGAALVLWLATKLVRRRRLTAADPAR